MYYNLWIIKLYHLRKSIFNIQLLDEECAWIDNQYWSYGDYQTVNDVSDYMTCCRLCKDDPKCTNFSYGKEGHGYAKQCMKKRGGSAQGRSEFISSPRDMTACSCGEGQFLYCVVLILKCKFFFRRIYIYIFHFFFQSEDENRHYETERRPSDF